MTLIFGKKKFIFSSNVNNLGHLIHGNGEKKKKKSKCSIQYSETVISHREIKIPLVMSWYLSSPASGT